MGALLNMHLLFVRSEHSSAPKAASLMSSSSSSPHDSIASLLQSDDFKSAMRSALLEALGSTAPAWDPTQRDEQVTPPVFTELYTPSENERERCPGIWPTDPRAFFRRNVSS